MSAKFNDGSILKRRKLSVIDEMDSGNSSDVTQEGDDTDADAEAEAYLDQTFHELSALQGFNSTFRDYSADLLNFYNISGSLNSSVEDGTENVKSPSDAKNNSATLDKTITQRPSNTSKNFENTFKLLQQQVYSNQHKSFQVLNQLKYDSKFVTDTSPSTGEATSTAAGAVDFDLQLEAMERIRQILNDKNFCDITKSTVYEAERSLLAFLHDFACKGQKNCFGESSKVLTKCQSADDVAFDADDNNLIYHVAKNLDGQNCLRVVRSLLINKVLCGNRVSQMTRAYDDIEAVTRLLEEKEKDLELTVQIGKELLTQNNTLEARINDLEADLKSSNDDRAQLLHELHKKNELIAVLTNDADDGNETPTMSKSITLDLLQKKITVLQDENKTLKTEASQLASKTDEVEEHERKLMEDISAQMSEANTQFDHLSLELERQREENRLQHEQIVNLTARLAEAEMRLHQLTQDNDEHLSLLNITKENQNSLALELVEFKQRYEEVLALLHAAQDQLKLQRKKTQPQARSSFIGGGYGTSCGVGVGVGTGYGGGGMLQPESLQSELMGSSMYSENSLDSGISGDSQRSADRISRLMAQLPVDVSTSAAYAGAGSMAGGGMVPPYKRIFDTVRCATKHGNYADSGNISMSNLGAMSMSSASGPRMSATTYPAGSYYRGESNNKNGLGVKTLSAESLFSQSDEGYPAQPAGVPGAPGAKELEAALKRLTPAEVLARRAMLSYAPAGTYNYDEPSTQTHNTALPLGVRTPDSIMSTGSSNISTSAHMSVSITSNQWRLPEKLQIVKPIEGSQTLHHWSRLATPTLGGLLDDRPGVTIRGGRGLDDLGMQMYTLSDVEEDVSEEMPGKQFEAPGCIYTFTTSTVIHPDDGFVNDLSFLSQSQMSSRMASTSTSRQPSCPPTPRAGISRKNSCSTFSVNLGLASMLNERGIKAVTPSALNTPAGPNFTPTVTPCNSPEGSPPRSQSPEPLFGLLTSGAEMIRRKLIGGDIERPNRYHQQNKQQKILLSRLERRALRSLKLVEKVESIGLENIIAAQPSQLASGIANRSSSPLSQFGSLKSLHSSSNSIVDDIHFDRAQIKGVLHKGLRSPAAASVSSSTSAYNSDSDEQLGAVGFDRGNVIKGNEESSAQSTVDAAATTSKSRTPSTTRAAAASVAEAEASELIAPVPLACPTDSRVKQMQRQKSRRNLKNGMAAQRPDLGTIGGGSGGRVRPDLGRVASTAQLQATRAAPASASDTIRTQEEAKAAQSITQAFVGSVSSLLFGRKGGWL